MKKYFFIALAICTCALGFTACSEDEGEDSNFTVVANPAETVASKYNITSIAEQLEADIETISDPLSTSIDIEPADQPHVATVKFTPMTLLFRLKDPKTGEYNGQTQTITTDAVDLKCNVYQQGANRFVLTNTSTGNALGFSFRAYVVDGKFQANYIMSVKNGRKKYDYKFTLASE